MEEKKLNDEDIIKALNDKGYAAYICYGAESAKNVVLRYLKKD